MTIYKNIPKLPGVYRIYNEYGSYIGASINMNNRIMKHFSYLKNNVHSNDKLQRIYNKYPNSLKVEILKILDTEDRELLLYYETFFHIEYDSVNNGFNYDLPIKITNRFTLSEEQIQKSIKKSCKKVLAFNRYTGTLHKEFKSISEAALYCNGQSTNISKVCKGQLNHIYGYVFCYKSDYDDKKEYKFPEHYRKGKKHSNNHIKNMIINNKNSKPIFVYDLNMKFIAEFSSRRQCEIFYEFKKEVLRYKVDKETPFGGYFFRNTKI